MRAALVKRKILNFGAICISYVKLIPQWFQFGKNSLILDCGANVGHITKLFASTGATVISFEPDPRAFRVLKKRFGTKKNIQLIQKGVWIEDTTIQLYTHKESKHDEISFTVGSSIVADKINVDTARGQSVEVVDLVAFMKKQNRKIDLVKLDVEGAEIEILKQIIDTKSWNLFDRMYVETHETKIPSQLKELGYINAQFKEHNITHIKLNWI